jgi:Domain of unknown function (DUF4394)
MFKPFISFRSGAGVRASLGALFLFASTAVFATNPQDCGSGRKDDRSKSLRVVGLTDDGHLVCFNEHAPKRLREIGYVSGLMQQDSALIGIDFRVQDGLLYGVGNGGGVYQIDTSTAVATPVNSLTMALDGASFGVDFNPAADRLRIVSDTGQNLRHNVNAGGVTLSDGALNYTLGTTTLGIAGAAYTNNDLDATTATTLFDTDTSLDQIAIQSPPNNGSLVATGALTVDAAPVVGFDIYSWLDRGGITASNRGYAVINSAYGSGFYRVSLLTGKANFVGPFRQTVVDIAVPLNQ